MGELDFAKAHRLADEPELTPLHPSFIKVLRIRFALLTLPPLIAATVLEIAGMPVPGMVLIPVLLIAFYLVAIVPARRYRSRGYNLGPDRLRVVKGTLFHSDTTVPFGRVQHLDVEQRPIERYYGLATLILHTAGTHNASVRLPGLPYETAQDMREQIREHVRSETM